MLEILAGASSGITKPLLAVTGSQRPYIFDVPHLLSLPEGFEFRFRYRHSWVQPEVLESLARDSTAFAGREVIILFHSQESRHIVPIRSGTIIGLEELGPMILCRFRVGSFSKISLDLTQYIYPSTPRDAQRPVVSKATQALFERARHFLGPTKERDDFDLSQPLPNGWYLREATGTSNMHDWDQ
jgi:hypothetical protein